MKKVSVIVVYNNKEKVDEAINYVNQQSIINDVEIIAIDNIDGKFKSSAAALNFASEKADGEVLVYIHQDMLLTDEKALEIYYNFLIKKEKCIIGPAGYSIEKKQIITDIARWKDRVYNMPPANGSIEKVYSLDECMFAMKKSLWKELGFNEKVCDNWHFYAVETCYRNMINGGDNYVLPLKLWHKSTPGVSFNKYFLLSTKKFIKEYKEKVDVLYAPCITIRCNMLAFRWYVLKKKVKKILKK